MNGEIILEKISLIGDLSVTQSLCGELSVDYAKTRYKEIENDSGGLTAFIERERG